MLRYCVVAWSRSVDNRRHITNPVVNKEDPMALDYKTLQAVVVEQPPLPDQYCPECGQSLRHSVAMSIDKPSSGPLWWVLLVVGISLLTASGVRALSDYQWVARPELPAHV